jgi:hypothetical protein
VGNQRILCQNDVWFKVIQHCEAQPNGIQSAEAFAHAQQLGQETSHVSAEEQPLKKRKWRSRSISDAAALESSEDDFCCEENMPLSMGSPFTDVVLFGDEFKS